MAEIDCNTVIKSYINALETDFEVIGREDDKCVMLTPFRRPDGGYIEVELSSRPDGDITISDMGESITYLLVNGLTVGRKTVDDARRVCKRFGADLVKSEILVETTPAEEGMRFNEFVQAALAVSEMIQRRRPMNRIQFADVVESLLVSERAVYDTDFSVKGKVQLHRVAFCVNSTSKVLIQPLSANSESVAFSWAERWAYRFADIYDADPEWDTLSVLDDRGERADVWSERARLALGSHSTVVPWQEGPPLAKALATATNA